MHFLCRGREARAVVCGSGTRRAGSGGRREGGKVEGDRSPFASAVSAPAELKTATMLEADGHGCH